MEIDLSFLWVLDDLRAKFMWGLRAVIGDKITIEQYRILNIIAKEGRNDLTCVAIRKQLPGFPDLTRTIDCLVKKGLVTRQRSDADRRMVLISLTGEGRAIFEMVDQRIKQLFAMGFKGKDLDDLKKLVTLARKLVYRCRPH